MRILHTILGDITIDGELVTSENPTLQKYANSVLLNDFDGYKNSEVFPDMELRMERIISDGLGSYVDQPQGKRKG